MVCGHRVPLVTMLWNRHKFLITERTRQWFMRWLLKNICIFILMYFLYIYFYRHVSILSLCYMWRRLHFVNDSDVIMSSYIHYCCSHFKDKVSVWYSRTPCITSRRDGAWMASGNFWIWKAPREHFVWWWLRLHGKRWWKMTLYITLNLYSIVYFM